MYRIGEFSLITGLTVKALRFYHEHEILVPARVERETGYRFYDESQVETAFVIRRLRALEFGVKEIREIVAHGRDDADILSRLEDKRGEIVQRLSGLRTIQRSLDRIIAQEKEARATMATIHFDIEQKTIAPQTVAGIRMRGRYSDCSTAFRKLGRHFGRHMNGKPMMLVFDGEYKEEDADFEPCMPVKRSKAVDGVEVRELPGGTFLSLMHQGPYDTLGRSYGKLMDHLKRAGKKWVVPTREIYHKGPGMIFRGNPAKYLTEILIRIES